MFSNYLLVVKLGKIYDHETKDFDDLEEDWQTILDKVKEGKEFETYSIQRSKDKYFYAKSKNNQIKISRAKNKSPSCDISTPRTVTLTNLNV